MAKLLSTLLLLLLLLSTTISIASSTSFTLTNNCPYTVWPGVLSNADKPRLPSIGFALSPTETRILDSPPSWAGRLWARTLCSTDSAGRFSCATGDCGSGTVECSGNGAAPPATLAEFTLNGSAGLDFYDVSLVDGYNLPMLVVPQGGSGGGCNSTGCVVDLNGICPAELRVVGAGGGSGGVVACKSACEAFGSAEYCCSGAFASPKTCGPSKYSQLFKNLCPSAYSYAYDDLTSTFTCAAASNYLITFCPSTGTAASVKWSLSKGNNVTMVFSGGEEGNVTARPPGGGEDVIGRGEHVLPMLNLVSLSLFFLVLSALIQC